MLRSLMSKRSLGLALAGSLCGCPDPESSYEAFLSKRPEAGVMDMRQGSGLLDVSGEYLLAISTFISPATPILFKASVRFEDLASPTPEHAASLYIVLQPLQCQYGEPCMRVPVGEPYDELVLPVRPDGTFEVGLGERTVPGVANPVSGRDIRATLILSGAIRSANEFCGDILGELHDPFQAMFEGTGSSFGVTRVADYGTADLDYLPVKVSAKCSGTAPEADMGIVATDMAIVTDVPIIPDAVVATDAATDAPAATDAVVATDASAATPDLPVAPPTQP